MEGDVDLSQPRECELSPHTGAGRLRVESGDCTVVLLTGKKEGSSLMMGPQSAQVLKEQKFGSSLGLTQGSVVAGHFASRHWPSKPPGGYFLLTCPAPPLRPYMGSAVMLTTSSPPPASGLAASPVAHHPARSEANVASCALGVEDTCPPLNRGGC